MNLKTCCSSYVFGYVIRKQFMFSIKFYCDAPTV